MRVPRAPPPISSPRETLSTAQLQPLTFAEEFVDGPPRRPPESKGRRVSSQEERYIFHRMLEGAFTAHTAMEIGIHRSTAMRAIRRWDPLPYPLIYVVFTRVPAKPQAAEFDNLTSNEPGTRPWIHFCRHCGLVFETSGDALGHLWAIWLGD